MADWSKISNRGNVEDRRGFAPVVGGISLTSLAILIVYGLATGSPPEAILSQILGSQNVNQNIIETSEYEGADEYEQFTSAVLGSSDEFWDSELSEIGVKYNPPTLVLFRQATESACGIASSEVGPHYCPLDSTIYIDETFFDELTQKFGATGGDVAEAYVIAHEVGHHIQNQLGILSELNSNPTNENSIRVELQADCFAGVWANSIKDQGVLEPGEIREAIDAAASVGDDRIQSKVTGYVNPESWTHGSSEERVKWFKVGYEEGDVMKCSPTS